MTDTKKRTTTLGIRNPYVWILTVLVLAMFLLSIGSSAGMAVLMPPLITLELSLLEWTQRWCIKGDRRWSLWRFVPVLFFGLILAVCLFGVSYSEAEPLTDQLNMMPLWICAGLMFAGLPLAMKVDLSMVKGTPKRLDKPLFAFTTIAAIGAVLAMVLI